MGKWFGKSCRQSGNYSIKWPQGRSRYRCRDFPQRDFGTTFEDSLSAQYRRLMENIPTEIWLSAELTALDNPRKEACRDAIYRYLDLSNEQAFLYCKKRVTDDTWTEWREGIEGNLRLPAFRAVWADVARNCPNSFKELRKLSPPSEPLSPKNLAPPGQ